MMAQNWDTARICLNGHVLTAHLSKHPDSGNFCAKCGAKAIDHCPNCNTPIHGLPFNWNNPWFKPPTYCHECGEPYPWAGRVLAVEKDRIIRLTSLAYWFQVTMRKLSAVSVWFRRLLKPPWTRSEIFQLIGILAVIAGIVVTIILYT